MKPRLCPTDGRDERLHESALTSIYNLRSRPEVVLLLDDANCRDAMEDAAVRLDQNMAAREAEPKLREVLRCLASFDGGQQPASQAMAYAAAAPMVVMQCVVPAGATAGTRISFMTPKGPIEVRIRDVV